MSELCNDNNNNSNNNSDDDDNELILIILQTNSGFFIMSIVIIKRHQKKQGQGNKPRQGIILLVTVCKAYLYGYNLSTQHKGINMYLKIIWDDSKPFCRKN